MADLPGLIEGASEGAGLGEKFLKHAMRTRVIAHVLDMGSFEGRDPLEDYKIIRNDFIQKISDVFGKLNNEQLQDIYSLEKQDNKFYLRTCFKGILALAIAYRNNIQHKMSGTVDLINMFKEKKLYKSTDRKLDGVCAGIGEYFGMDPTVIRLAWVLFSILGGSGILAYIIAAIIIPRRPEF